MKRLLTISAIVCFFIGLGVFLYPTFMDYFDQYMAHREIAEFDENIEDVKSDKKAFESFYNAVKDYNDSLYIQKQNRLVDPFSYEQKSFDLKEFGFKKNIFGTISIPKIDIEYPIYLGASKANMRKGIAHLTQTSLPIGEKNSRAVFAGHRGSTKGVFFKNLDKLDINDKIIISNPWETLVYHVSDIKVIEPNQVDQILIQDNQDMISLLTCHPYPINNKRLLVSAVRETTVQETKEVKKEMTVLDYERIVRKCVFVFLGIVIVLLILKRVKHRKKD